MIRIGCSGWSYRDWRGVVYPADLPQRRWLEHYQQLFDTVELNSTFYRLPTTEAVEGWAAAARPGFLYAFKLGAFGSHRKKLRDPTSWLPNHLDRASGSATTSDRPSCSCRRGGSATSSDWTNSWR